MNERIEGLWWKARIGYNNQNCDPEVLEKFAELIVRECAEVSANEFLMKVYKGPHQAHAARQAVLTHFGVEE